MTNRREFIKTIAGVPPLLALGSAFAAPDPSRVALIIGNAAYEQSPLANPVNDAADMRDLFNAAGFTTDSLLNAKRAELMASIDRFTSAVQRSETRQAVFYYAGHGAQLDWRNYLLPVDISVQSPEDVKSQCIDLGIILGRLSKLKDKTLIIILDACRDDPFRGAYRPEQKGLSQFDAPVGSLLAYATSPGNVAADGRGKNGLYTENLLRELSNRTAKIEDALKRVRLNVRMGSQGEQVPWETTSLESDVYIFPDGQKKLSEAEQEKIIEEELSLWAQLKSSKSADDWVAYLRKYPNGRFAEIASNRLSRLLEGARNRPVPSASPAVSPTTSPTTSAITSPAAPTPASAQTPSPPVPQAVVPTSVQTAPQAPMLIIKPGGDMSIQIQQSANPNSAGKFPLGRRYSVGDEVTARVTDILTGVQGESISLRVTKVDEDNDRVELNDGVHVWDTMGNRVKEPGTGVSETPRQLIPSEFYVGKKWNAAWITENPRFGRQTVEMALNIAAFENIEVPAGKFQAFRIDSTGWSNDRAGSMSIQSRLWVAPGLNFSIRGESIFRRQGRMVKTDRLELVSLSQAHVGSDCLLDRTKSRNLVIRSSCSR